MTDQQIMEAVRERVAGIINDAPAVEIMSNEELADKLLSTRLNDKLEPDPKGRYVVCVGDLNGLPVTDELVSWSEVKGAGFIRRVG